MKKDGFYAMMHRMKNITRWGLMRNAVRENLSEHSFDTAVTAHALAVIGKEYFDSAVDPGQVTAAALFHDAPEILTGDLPTPVKYNNPEIQTAYKSIEHSAADSLLKMLPERLRPSYQVLFSYEHDSPEIYRYVKAADKISGYIKCVEELKCGNNEFRHAAQQLREAIAQQGLPEADYYMEHFAPAFECTLDELQED